MNVTYYRLADKVLFTDRNATYTEYLGRDPRHVRVLAVQNDFNSPNANLFFFDRRTSKMCAGPVRQLITDHFSQTLYEGKIIPNEDASELLDRYDLSEYFVYE